MPKIRTAVILAASVTALALFGGTLTPAQPHAEAPRAVAVVMHERHVELLHRVPAPITLAYAGDSITTLTYLGQSRGELSWLNHLAAGVTIVGGYAESGMRTDQIAAAMPATGAKVLVVMAGTNDVRQNHSAANAMVYVDAIVTHSGVANDDVIVSAIAPSNSQPAQTIAYNTLLEQHAAERGWVFVDPWREVREPDGTYTPGATYDGAHPRGPVQFFTARTLHAAIVAVATAKVMAP